MRACGRACASRELRQLPRATGAGPGGSVAQRAHRGEDRWVPAVGWAKYGDTARHEAPSRAASVDAGCSPAAALLAQDGGGCNTSSPAEAEEVVARRPALPSGVGRMGPRPGRHATTATGSAREGHKLRQLPTSGTGHALLSAGGRRQQLAPCWLLGQGGRSEGKARSPLGLPIKGQGARCRLGGFLRQHLLYDRPTDTNYLPSPPISGSGPGAR